MSELLLELFSEEIPSKMQVKAANQMLESLTQAISNLGLTYSSAQYFVTPRRITLYIADLPTQLPEKLIEKKGPKIDARSEAIEGFLRSVGMKLEELTIIDGFYYAKKLEAAQAAKPILKSTIEQLLISFTWPKSMRSAQSQTRWVRPLRNILCLFNGEILPIEFANLTANSKTFGHRFMAPNQLEISSFVDYQDKMRKAYVILSPIERQEIIINQVKDIAKELSLIPVLEESLLAEVTGLVEYPHVLLGKIDQEFIDLPKEVLVTAMKVHQRYFYLEDKNGKIAPYFLTAANIKHEDNSLIISGNEKVLRARLSDAQFFWNKDLQQPSSECLAKLARMTFHNKLGTMFDKVTRIIALAEFIATDLTPISASSLTKTPKALEIGDLVNIAEIPGRAASRLARDDERNDLIDINLAKKAALLCKTDLVTEMVGEFPELQGIMGKYYALHAKQETEVAIAIAEHYRPADTHDIGDISLLGAIISIADKIDTIVGLWLAGEKPTSSKDPFALRRSALGIIKLIRYHKLNLSISTLIDKAMLNYASTRNKEEITAFFNDRLKYYLKAENFRHDLIMASLAVNSDNINEAIQNLIALQEFMTNSKAETLSFAIKRILNILAESKMELSLTVNTDLCKPVELALYNQVKSTQANLLDLLGLVDIISQFFDEILVNDSDPKLKQNRLNLIYNVANLSNKIADFSYIENNNAKL